MQIQKEKGGNSLILETNIGQRKIYVASDGLVVQAENWPTVFMPMKKEELEALKNLISEAIQ